MNAYILRAKPHGIDQEEEFLSGQISVGWPCGKSLENCDRGVIASTLAKSYNTLSEISISMVDLFVHMPEGSIVLSPSINNKSLIHIFKTTSGYQYDSSKDNAACGNPHFIEAEHLKTVSRNTLPSPVFKSLSGARKTLSRISQHYGILDNYISSGFNVTKKIVNNTDGPIDATTVLYDLLSSEDEHIRLQAAIAVLNLEKNKKT